MLKILFLAFEFTKRRFQNTYGQQLPVWALLTSGSTGGVRPPGLFRGFGVSLIRVDCLLVSVLSVRYSAYYLLCWTSLIVASLTLADVVKSRIQLRATPPTGTPVQYIAHELKAIVAESGL
jgi:solute carrier family 25 (mitochondrial carnitine/acylcarnitine transporter), member 20/29